MEGTSNLAGGTQDRLFLRLYCSGEGESDTELAIIDSCDLDGSIFSIVLHYVEDHNTILLF